ncbi:MAG: ABC transporter permease [Bacteriovoracaceae bacterium]|nr:ABC transporter permease [Bacteriovoracaceae bacterium]
MRSLTFAIKNTRKSLRRSVLTASLVSLGVACVFLFFTYAGSFKNQIVGQITNSAMGHIQIHRQGYVESLDNMPLDKNLNNSESQQILNAISLQKNITSISKRLKFSGLISNYVTSTNVRLNGVEPLLEMQTLPALKDRLVSGTFELNENEVVIPEVVAKGMNLKVGDSVVIVTTNDVGSMNAFNFKVRGILGLLSGPGGKDGYVNLKDAQKLLRAEDGTINEIVLRTKSLDELKSNTNSVIQNLKNAGLTSLEVHTWEKLSPFTNISKIIDVLNLSVQIVLISLVLISILNIMIMGVYERIVEIGTLSAIGVAAKYIASVFIWEGVIIGLSGLIGGFIFSLLVIKLGGNFYISFGQQQDILLSPEFHLKDALFISGLVILVSIFAALYPALKAARMKPVDALRG